MIENLCDVLHITKRFADDFHGSGKCTHEGIDLCISDGEAAAEGRGSCTEE